MREKLIQYVNLLFEGSENSADIRQEILQNTLDHYDDLIAQGKTPEAAYRLSISGIGDIHELLGGGTVPTPPPASAPGKELSVPQKPEARLWQKVLRGIAIFLFIISPTPLIVLDWLAMDEIGLVGTLAICGLATALLIIAGRSGPRDRQEEREAFTSPQAKLRRSIGSVLWALCLALYFLISFKTNDWHITWVIFPICGAGQGLLDAILDLKEANEHEK